jgi:hypothetical protein
MSSSISRAQRRALAKIRNRADRELANDRVYFQLHPHRRHFVRKIYKHERMYFEILNGGPFKLEPERSEMYVAVASPWPGARLRAPFFGRGLHPEWYEELASATAWHFAAPHVLHKMRDDLIAKGPPP